MAFKFSRIPSSEINVIRKNSHVLITGEFRFSYRKNNDGAYRMTIIVPKKVNRLATARNRIKRIVRESLNIAKSPKDPIDIIIDVRSDISDKRVGDLALSFNELFLKII